jgi:hypothetical protein
VHRLPPHLYRCRSRNILSPCGECRGLLLNILFRQSRSSHSYSITFSATHPDILISMTNQMYTLSFSSSSPSNLLLPLSSLEMRKSQEGEENFEMKFECFRCKGMCGEWISMQFGIVFCDECISQSSIQGDGSIIELLHVNELNENDYSKLSLGGNKRFQQFLRCLSLLKGYHFETPAEIFSSPSVLYYRDVLQDEYEQRQPRPYDEEYYDQLSRKYSSPPPHCQPRSPQCRKKCLRWAPDNSTSECMICNAPFTLLKRRHHCRTCGLCLCGDCAPSAASATADVDSCASLLRWKSRHGRKCKFCLKRKKSLQP